MKERDKAVYELVIFDLDGTLLDTSPGIFNSVRYAEQQLDLQPIREDELREFVGPPPKEMYKMKYNLDESGALRATQKHREYGSMKAIYEATKYPAMDATLQQMKNQGIRLAVATLKKQNVAEKILEHFNMKCFFDVIVGMDEQETYTKSQAILIAMNSVGTAKALMVGDSRYDYEGAVQAKVDFVGVLYGFGFNANEAYSFSTINEPEELLELVL